MNVTNSLQEELQQHQHQHLASNTASNEENEEEPIVTSTSNDLSYSSPSYVQQQQLQQPNIDSTIITSPARITSSTGNDCSTSPSLQQQQQQQQQQQHHQQQEQQQQERPPQQDQPQVPQAATREFKPELTVDGSSEDDSRSRHEFASSVLTQQQRQRQQEETQGRGMNVDDTVMPTKSTESSAVTNSLGPNSSDPINPLSVFNPTLCEGKDMVARNLSAPAVSDSAECGNVVVDNVSPSEAPVNQKIILKLPRPSTAAAVTNMSHQIDVDPTTSNSSSNSSSTPGEDTRKVEPLKINLHNTHSNAAQQHNVPKITIKPIIKNQTEENDASCSSSADDDPPIPKLTIKAVSSNAHQHASSNIGTSEPHIVPKLTIRSASGEEGSGAPHSASILPRLTIKMSDSQSSSTSAAHNSLLSASSCSSNAGNLLKSPASMTSSACSTPSPPLQKSSEQVPLPKLTIKTSLDGTSNSIISHISPASLSSSSTSSSSSVSIACTSQPLASATSIPKLTIKTIPKPEELIVPKLTIKTNAAGNSECASITPTSSTAGEALEEAASSKVPKLTIKTGQDAVIITQHSAAVHAQSVPKLTIKTKSLDVAEMASGLNQADHNDEPPPEKIPKITIKTNEVLDKGTDAPKFCIKTTSSNESLAQQQQQQQQQPTIPKLTITVSNLDCGGNTLCGLTGGERGPQSPLIVRQVPSTSRKATTTSASPERVPKLMISRQDSGCSNSILVVSNHSGDTVGEDNKVVPKLTIKTSSLPSDTAESKESKPTKFSIRTVKSTTEDEKIPKLTIKSVTQSAATIAPQQSSEESDECVSLSSCSSPVQLDDRNTNAKIVPKLTIKNLSSPQPIVKTVMIDADMTMPASKKSAKNGEPKNDLSDTIENESIERADNLPQVLMAMDVVEETIDEAFATSVVDAKIVLPTANGGESSSSQEFCGFNDNTTDSNIESANMISLNLQEEEPRRLSDDMDIDESLQQQHAPQVFNNVTHFESSNGDVDGTLPAPTPQLSETAAPGYLLAPLKHPKLTHVIDTVDLTSSPSPGSSPAHFNYTEPDTSQMDQPKATDFLLGRLQMHRETSVIQQATTTISHNILLNKLTSQSKALSRGNAVDVSSDVAAHANPTLPSLQPKPENCITSNSAKYPHLAERLLANGLVHASQTLNSKARGVMPPAENVIVDSIEILDTPDGSPRSSLDEESVKITTHHINHMESSRGLLQQLDNCKEVDIHNNNNMIHSNHGNLKRHITNTPAGNIQEVNRLERGNLLISPSKLRRIESDGNTMATITILTNDLQEPANTVLTSSPTMIKSNHCRDGNSEIPASPTIVIASQSQALSVSVHRSRKQKHEHLLTMPPEEQDPLQLNCNDIANVGGGPIGSSGYFECVSAQMPMTHELGGSSTTTVKRRGRPRKAAKNATPLANSKQQQNNFDAQRAKGDYSPSTPAGDEEKAVKSRLSRVQLLRKRLAIDMVATEQPPPILDEQQLDIEALAESTKRDRTLRTPLRPSRRSVTPNTLVEGGRGKRHNEVGSETRKLQRKKSVTETSIIQRQHQHFGGSNSSMSSCSTSSLSSTTTATAVAMAAQIDLTMCSSSSSNGSQTITTVEASVGGGNRPINCMLPPTTILSSSDPLADVVFKPNDFSSLVAAQQLRAPIKSRRMSAENANIILTPTSARSRKGSRTDSQDDDGDTGGSGADNSGDDSASSVTSIANIGRGRGRGRGRSGRGSAGLTRGGGGGGVGGGGGSTRPPRLGRGASSVAKAIAMSRPRCVGGLKHTPDPERLKGLFSPAPQVFEEDTRMSADLNQTAQVAEVTAPSPAPVSVSTGLANRQMDFLTNEESQSSIISNNSILDPNTIAAVQNGAQQQKRPKKKKMEVCVSEDTEFTVASIAEYEWPPPKGCCPSKNRDTFMIQEQVALYLGIKSFKRKYPDLPRRQVDMEERNWLQEKNLVSEKMCDLGITAVWASDILDIMYTDFYEKYEEYKEFIRQKHVREIEAKHKALGLNVSGRGLQARDRALQSASKWNTFFNKSRKEERNTCMDLQTLTVNVPLPSDAPIKMVSDRSIVEAVTTAVKEVSIPEAPPLPANPITVSSRPWLSYPLALVPGQYCEKYRHYTPFELRSYPINTVLDDPQTLYERLIRDGPSNLQDSSETDTESATETATPTVRTSSYINEAYGLTPSTSSKRKPVRRSRRARTNAIQQSTPTVTERAKSRSDKEDEQGQSAEQPANNEGGGSSKSDEEKSQDSSTSTSDSESSTSASDTDSDSDSSSCSSADLESCAKCGVCQRTQNRNLKNLPEVFLKCYTCRRRVHPSCIEMPYRMTTRVRNYNWQCAECKCCIKCKRKQDQNKMLFCEQCDRGFHIYCIDGKSVPEGRWSCERCSVCIRCGATKPEGLGSPATNLMGGQHPQTKQAKQKKVKWINEYRIDHITKLREHCSMLCVPCGRLKATNKRNNQYGGGMGGVALANVYSQMSPPSAPSSVISTTTMAL